MSVYVCPDCGGSLWQADAGRFTRFRCHVGHVYGGEDLLEALTEQMERSMWTVARGLQDKANLARQLATGAGRRGDEEQSGAIEQMIAAATAVNRGA